MKIRRKRGSQPFKPKEITRFTKVLGNKTSTLIKTSRSGTIATRVSASGEIMGHDTGASYTPEYVKAVVESAGRTQMMQPNDGCWPGGYKSCWPDAPDDSWFAYNANDARPKFRATIEQIDEMYMVTEKWLPLITIPYYRKTIVRRMLTYPDSGRPVYNWVRLGRKLREDRRTVKRWYEDGIRHLTDRLNQCSA